jgi:hypothetical protein
MVVARYPSSGRPPRQILHNPEFTAPVPTSVRSWFGSIVQRVVLNAVSVVLKLWMSCIKRDDHELLSRSRHQCVLIVRLNKLISRIVDNVVKQIQFITNTCLLFKTWIKPLLLWTSQVDHRRLVGTRKGWWVTNMEPRSICCSSMGSRPLRWLLHSLGSIDKLSTHPHPHNLSPQDLAPTMRATP